jgi:hypothetical protein
LLYWIGTHISQRDPKELEQRALQFIEKVHLAATRKDQDYVINNDQSPIPFTFDRQSTLELVGMRTVDIHKSMGDTKWATFLALIITTSGKMLTPVSVFKGNSDGHIAMWDFATYTCGCICLDG